jgi:DNA-binding transcriptional ArsR family regulator
MKFKHAKKLDKVLVALANEKRRDMVYALGLQPRSITQLANELGLSLQAIHRHIGILEDAGLAQRRKSGRVNFLALDRSGLVLMQDWIGQYNAYWGSNRETLENYVAGIERAERNLARRKQLK